MKEQLKNLKKPWILLSSEDCISAELELKKELTERHVLFGLEFNCLAKRQDSDDFLFFISSSKFSYAVVHLTWSHETDPRFPYTETYIHLDEWFKTRHDPDVVHWN